MRTSIELIADVILHTSRPLRQIEDRPQKVQKHRYERRKVREYLRLGDWLAEA